jgi:hypothetical protein
VNENVVSLNIQNANTGQTIPPTMHGVILETNINRDDDGGLYAELIYNRAFQGQSSSYKFRHAPVQSRLDWCISTYNISAE